MKTFNHFLMLACSLFTLSQTALAQNESGGIYKTAYDFRQNKLSYAVNVNNGRDKIKSDMLLREGKVKVISGGRVYTLDKRDVYGYKSPDGAIYRFYRKNDYKVLNAGEPLTLYAYLQGSSSGRANMRIYADYYFSSNLSSAPQHLTIENLKAAFPGNRKFQEALDENFKTDEDLTAYDGTHKMYRLVETYKNSLK
ncbi:MAG TPA: hypothetical protein VFE53_08505 [Mucilaginibacter sp.]|jgi:hypothetical protein|nr:hypothetical protein [Mucilaginibacter sp.]